MNYHLSWCCAHRKRASLHIVRITVRRMFGFKGIFSQTGYLDLFYVHTLA